MPPETNKICRVKFIKLRRQFLQSLIIPVIGASRIMKGVENFVTLSRIFLSLSLFFFIYSPSPISLFKCILIRFPRARK